jgi:hypothetical protein
MMNLVKRRADKTLVLERPEYYIQTGSMFENPYGVPPDEIVKFIAENPAEVVAQVVFGKYVESSGLVFTGELIQNLFNRELPRVTGNAWVNKAVAEQARLQFERFGRFNNRFYGGIDFARQTDYTVLFCIDTLALPAQVVYFKRLNRVPWDTIYAEVGRAVSLFGPNWLADSTGPGGDAAMDALEGRVYCPKHHRANLTGTRCMRDNRALDCDPDNYLTLSCVEGFHFSAGTKKDLVDHLRVTLGVGYRPDDPDCEFGWLRSPPIVQLEEELSFYAWDDKKARHRLPLRFRARRLPRT